MKKLFLIFFLFSISLLANVVLKAPNNFTENEAYIFEFEVSGSSVKFPKIENIDGLIVESLGTAKSLQIINGNVSEKITKKYKVIPDKDFTIPSFDFTVDGNIVKSKSKNISEIKIKKTDSDDFDLTLQSSKKSLFVGEDLIIKLTFKYRKNLQITDLGFQVPHFENFWYEKLDNNNKRFEENGYIVQELNFLLFPQKSGKLEIKPLKIDVQMIEQNQNSNFNFFGAKSTLKKIYSNNLLFDVKELPNKVNLIGDFNIKASVDKSRINLGDSITFKLNIDGVGNFDDIKDFKLNIKNATIYDNKPEIKTNYSENGLKGNYSKVFTIVPNESFEIPSLQLEYYDKKENKIIVKNSKSFKIEVLGENKKEVILEKLSKKPTEEEVLKKDSTLEDKIVYFIFGMMFSLLMFGLYIYVKLRKSKKQLKESSLAKLVKKSRDKNQLIQVLIPYLKIDENLDKLIFDCQNKSIEFKILKKDILKILKELKL